MTRYLRAANVKDGFLDLGDVGEMNFDPIERETFALLPGDVLVTEGSGSLRAVGASAVWEAELEGTVCFQNTLLRLRPRPSTDGRYLAWWCRHAFADGLFSSIATGANIFHISAERVRSLPMTYLPLPDQRAIADYLDAETARIDALITKKRRMIDLLQELTLEKTDHLVWSGGHPKGQLKRLVPLERKIMYGIVLPGPNVENGALLIKGGDTKAGRLDPRTLARTAFEIEAKYVRSRVKTGDLLFAIRGGVGDVEIAPPSIEGANITQDVARISPKEGIDGRWLLHALRSPSAGRDGARTAVAARP